MSVLAFDTAGPVIGVALWHQGRATVRTERVRRGAEARLVPWARELCEEAGLAMSELDGVGVARGPGAFTGVRVGLATAVGLAMGLEVPLWAGSSLASRAARAPNQLPVLAMLDARKSRVYAALYEVGRRVEGPGDVAPEVALGWVSGAFEAVGEGALVYAELVEAAGGVVVPEADDPAVDALARQAAEALDAGKGIDPVVVEPLYLRPPDAKKPKR